MFEKVIPVMSTERYPVPFAISYSRMKNGQRAIRKRTAAARRADMILF